MGVVFEIACVMMALVTDVVHPHTFFAGFVTAIAVVAVMRGMVAYDREVRSGRKR